jgi:hypothetical protein
MLRVCVALAVLLSGCTWGLPAPECDRTQEQSGIACAVAVEAALDAVRDRQAEIERIQFLYGCAVPCTGRVQQGDNEDALRAYVVFTYRDGSAEFVALTLSDNRLLVADPAEY